MKEHNLVSIALTSWFVNTFAHNQILLTVSPPSIGWDGKENLVVTKCINQSRFERYANFIKLSSTHFWTIKTIVLEQLGGLRVFDDRNQQMGWIVW